MFNIYNCSTIMLFTTVSQIASQRAAIGAIGSSNESCSLLSGPCSFLLSGQLAFGVHM